MSMLNTIIQKATKNPSKTTQKPLKNPTKTPQKSPQKPLKTPSSTVKQTPSRTVKHLKKVERLKNKLPHF